MLFFFFFQAEDGIRDVAVTGVQTCALPILSALALAWVLAQPGVGIVLAGARSPEQGGQNLAGARPLTPGTLAEVARIVADAFPSGRATEALTKEASTRAGPERFIFHRLDGRTSAALV